MAADGFDTTAFIALALSFLHPALCVTFLAGCGTDVCINLCLLILGVIPAYFHAWYLVYVYLDNKKLLKAPIGGRPFVYSDRLNGLDTLNRSTASLPAPRTSTEVVAAHRRNPAVQEKLAQEQKPATKTKPAIEPTSGRPTPVSTPGPSIKSKAAQPTSARATPTPSPLPLLDNRDGHSPKTKDQ
ncbi:hypothetical protein QBC40DRAFT_104620 [Triangularia verruculosa]|uniref:Uncharacterized protein n=1 Tax=Triangularia verruculosa TaxID=2587418 RepID=A0AAN7AYH5_9PEZI|nr:hypothetical protein QBC40DRAFT_104620 [Triangularia verruculosa]